jgi:hypothetical protein
MAAIEVDESRFPLVLVTFEASRRTPNSTITSAL